MSYTSVTVVLAVKQYTSVAALKVWPKSTLEFSIVRLHNSRTVPRVNPRVF